MFTISFRNVEGEETLLKELRTQEEAVDYANSMLVYYRTNPAYLSAKFAKAYVVMRSPLIYCKVICSKNSKLNFN